jgi:hypothetical protein
MKNRVNSITEIRKAIDKILEEGKKEIAKTVNEPIKKRHFTDQEIMITTTPTGSESV